MKFIFGSLVTFLIFLIVNLNNLTINGLENQLQLSTRIDNLKDKYIEKILSQEIGNKQIDNKQILSALESKIKIIYKKLNLKIDDLFHLKKLVKDDEEYNIFLKIIIDNLNSIKEFDNNNNYNKQNAIIEKQKQKHIKVILNMEKNCLNNNTVDKANNINLTKQIQKHLNVNNVNETSHLVITKNFSFDNVHINATELNNKSINNVCKIFFIIL